jgi:NCAIR mutase (PurE)-related protein
MEPEWLRDLLKDVQQREVSIDDALARLRGFPYEDLGFARLDSHRTLRKGFPEVIFCPGKTKEQIVQIVQRIRDRDGRALAARAEPEVAEAVQRVVPEMTYHPAARMIVVGPPAPQTGRRHELVVSAGTADIPVADEAAVTAATLGSPVERLFDVGVAGIHRLFDNRDKLFAANVLVVVAGMEGALAGVVAGLVDRPVIAVPTSIGYGANFHGLAALLTMLNSCSPGVSVVNIDNGFGAGYLAHLVNQ